MSASGTIMNRTLLRAIWPALCAPALVHAADEPADSSSTAQMTLAEVVVTAQKRGDQRLQDVPMSITALDGKELKASGAFAFVDYANSIPGLSFESLGAAGGRDDNTSGRNLSVRGVTTGTDGLETVSFYIDDTPLPPQDPKLADIDHIEVLRGPQGTLYGASSMGGTIRVITNQPDLSGFAADVATKLSVTEGGGENYHVSGMINAPLADDVLAVRASGYALRNSGYIDRVYGGEVTEKEINDERSHGFRAAARYTPHQSLVLTPSVLFQRIEVGGLDIYNPAVGELRRLSGIAEPSTEEFVLYALSAAFDAGWADFYSSTSFYDSESSGTEDLTSLLVSFFPDLDGAGSARNTVDITQQRFVQEARLSTKLDGPFQALLGLFYLDSRRIFDQHLPDTTGPSAAEFFGGASGDLLYALIGGETKQTEIAAFSELSYEITDELQATIGVRWSRTKSEFTRAEDGILNGGASMKAAQATETNVIPKLLLSYKPSDQLMTYVTVSEGFRPGVGNFPVPQGPCGAELAELGFDAAPTSFDSDSLRNYEIGAKWTTPDRRLTVNASAYRIDWSQIQANVALACGFGFVTNAGEARSTGFELELAAIPIEGLSLSTAVGYTDAKYTRVPDFLAAVQIEQGRQLPFVPEWTLSATADYRYPLNALTEAFVRADFRWVDERSNSLPTVATDMSVPELSAYDTLNLRLGIEHDRWTTALYVDNAFDERPRNSVRILGVGPATVATTRPRTVGISVSREF